MTAVVVFAVGSSLAVELEESLARAGHSIAAGVRNVDAVSRLIGGAPIVSAANLPQELLRHPFVVPLFQPANRKKAVREADGYGFDEAMSLIDPTCILPRRLTHGRGFYVNAGCTLGSSIEAGDFVLVNRAASIGHHVVLSDFVSIGPGVVLAGSGWIESGVLIGAGAVVAPGVRIGADAVVGPGAVVTRDVPPATAVVGNPARVLPRRGAGS